MPHVAIQVLLYKSSADLPRLLQSLQAQTFQDWTLYVCENSTDIYEASIAKEVLASFGVAHTTIVAHENLGFSRGHNALYRLHGAPYILILNDDAILAPDYLERLVESLEQDRTLASATGLVYRASSIEDHSVIDTAGLEYRALGYVRDRFAGQNVTNIQSQSVFGASCVAALFRREALEDVSLDQAPFDPTFFMYKEDVDLAIRLQRKGYGSFLVAEALAAHVRSAKDEGSAWIQRIRSERHRNRSMRAQTYRNQWALYAYHGTWQLGWWDWMVTIWQELKRSASLFVLGSPILFVRTWMRIIREWPSMRARRQGYLSFGLPLKKLV